MDTNRHTYEIVINEANNAPKKFTYEGTYGHKPGDEFVNMPVAFRVYKDKAYIFIEGSDSPEDRIIDFSADEIRDSLRKVYLYHLLHYGKELTPKKMSLFYNNKEYFYDKETPNFPFMTSMITIPSDYQLIPFDDELIFRIIKESKSKQFKKDEYACLYAFLGGVGKEHANDQFIYYWTAINSYYNLVAREYNKMLEEELANDRVYQALSNREKKSIKDKYLSLSRDEKSMHALSILYTVDKRCTKARHTKLNNSNNDGNSDSSSDDNAIIVAMSTWFHEWNDKWGDMLHMLKNPSNNPHLMRLRELVFDKLCFSFIDAYAWVTFKFPYIFRCNSIHGSRAYLAFAGYDEPELMMVKGMCYAMRDFLNENIKKVFQKELLSEEDYRRIKYMCANYLPSSLESPNVQNYLKEIRI